MRAYRRPVIAAIVSVGAILASTLSATASELPAAVSGSLNGSDTPRLLDDVYAEVARQVPGFAGIRFDGPDNVRVLLTMPDQRKAERARDSLAAMWRDPKLSARHAHATPARYDFLQLKDWYDRFNRDALALAGVVLTDIDEGGNRLRVGVDDEQRELDVREVARRHNVPQAALHVEQTGTIRQTSGLRDLHRPLVGGLQVQTTAYNCTLGYAARWGSTDGILTNSHCTQTQGGTEGTLFGQPTLATVAGNEMLDPPLFTGGSCPSGRRCRYSDAAFANSFVSATINRGYIAKAAEGTPTWNGTDLFRMQSKFDHPPLGSVVTKVGRTTGLTRGVVDYTCATMNIAKKDITLLCQGHASYYNEGGDSGSPVFDEGYGRVMGISWGKSDTGSVFSPFGNVEYELGTLQVCAPGYAC